MYLSKTGLIIFIFFINSIVEISSGFVFGGIHSGLIRGGIIILILIYLIKDVKFDTSGMIIICFLTYIFILIVRNTNYLYALNNYTGLAISLIMFPIVLTHFDLSLGLQKLRKYVFIVIYIVTIHFFLAQIFKFGLDPYGLNVYLGRGNVYQTYILVYILLFLPFIISTTIPSKIKAYELVGAFLSIIPVLFIFRRAAVISLLIGILIFTILTNGKKMFIKYALVTCILFIPISPYLLDGITQRLETRTLDITEQQTSMRGQEIPIAIELIKTGDLKVALFGNELFDYRTLANTDRPLHVDVARLLIGAGVIGIVMYSLIYAGIWSSFISYRRNITDLKFRSILLATMLSLTFAFGFFSYSSQLDQVSSLSTLMIFYGILIKYLKESPIEIIDSNKHENLITKL